MSKNSNKANKVNAGKAPPVIVKPRGPWSMPNRKLAALPGVTPGWVDPDSVVGIVFLVAEDGANYASIHTDEGFALSCVGEEDQTQNEFILAVETALTSWMN